MEHASNEATQMEPNAAINLAEGIESIKRSLTFIGELVALNARLVAILPPAERKKAEVLTLNPLSLAAAHTPTESKTQGLTLAQFAKFFGVNPGTIRGHLVEVPSGPAPVLPAGKIPCRKVGRVRRIFPQDLLGSEEDRRDQYDNHKKETSSVEHEGDWRGQVDYLRFGGHRQD